jgi:hypothetical protein
MTLTRQITLKKPLTEVQEINSWAVLSWVGRNRCHIRSACSTPSFTTLVLNAPLANTNIGDLHSARTGKDIHQFIRNPSPETIK